MTLPVRNVRQLKGGTPQAKLHHLYKTVCRRGIEVHLTTEDILITPAVVKILLQRRSEDFDRRNSPGICTLLQLRQSWEDGPCGPSVSDSFRKQTRDLKLAAHLFYLLVQRSSAGATSTNYGNNIEAAQPVGRGI